MSPFNSAIVTNSWDTGAAAALSSNIIENPVIGKQITNNNNNEDIIKTPTISPVILSSHAALT